MEAKDDDGYDRCEGREVDRDEERKIMKWSKRRILLYSEGSKKGKIFYMEGGRKMT